METIFGISLDTYLIALATMAVVIVLIMAVITARQPLLVKLGARNFTRRKSQTVLIIIGLMLSTLIVSSALVTGDTVGQSITNRIYQSLGTIDVIVDPDQEQAAGVEFIDESDSESLRQALAQDQRVDGFSAILQIDIPAANQGERLSDPRAYLVGLDVDTQTGLEEMLETSGGGLARLSSLASNEVFISERLEKSLDLQVGEMVTLFVENTPYEFRVAEIVKDNGLTSKDQAGPGSKPGGGVIMPLSRALNLSNNEGPNIIVISVEGGNRNDLDMVGAVSEMTASKIETLGIPLEVVEDKKELAAIGSLVGSVFVAFFIIFGLFSIAAGLMLIFLTFVMLAAERRSEMGMARAVGMKRLHLTEMYIAEGMLYNVGSAMVGAALGVLVAWLMITLLGFIFASFGTQITLNVNPRALALAYLIGVVLTFVTVAISSWRAANLNIVRAIRDIPEPDLLAKTSGGLMELIRSTLSVIWGVFWLIPATGLVIALVIGTIWSLARISGDFGGEIATAASITVSIGLVLLLIVYVRKLAAYLYNRLKIFRLLFYPFVGMNNWSKAHRSSIGWAMWMLIFGVAGIYVGGWGENIGAPSWVGPQLWSYTGGTTLVMFAIGVIAVYFGAPARISFSTIGLLTVWLWLLPLPFSVIPWLPDEANGWVDPIDGILGLAGWGHGGITGDIEMFFVSGVAVTAASIFVVIYNSTVLLAPFNLARGALGGLMPAVRTAIAYPLANRFRTAMTLSMFTLVVFALVVMSILNHNFSAVFNGEEAQGGYDVAVIGNPANRIQDIDSALITSPFMDQNLLQDGIAETASLRTATGYLEGSSGNSVATKDGFYKVQGMDSSFIETNSLKLVTRARGYADDAEVFSALATGTNFAIVDESRLQSGGGQWGPGPGDGVFEIEETLQGLDASNDEMGWDPIVFTLSDPFSGLETDIQIIGIISNTATTVRVEWSALFVGESLVDQNFFGGYQDNFYVISTEGTDSIDLARGIESALLESGVQASSIAQEVEESASQSNAFSALFEGFTALGLIVGIAALGVIAFRTVAERRQQIGMLRAIGYRSRLIGVSFFLESTFISVTGILLGLGLGYGISYNLLTSEEFTEAGLETGFDVPWTRILIFIGLAFVTSSIMTLIPARSASRVPVAEALRYNG